MQKVKRFTPLFVFVGVFLVASNWWRIELFFNPVEVDSGAEIELFVTSWCPYCKKTSDYLSTLGVDFQESNIERSAAAKKRYDSFPGKGVPLLVIGGEYVRGYDRNGIRKLLEKQN